jgi:rRNA-processing protein FCF1
MRHKRAKQNRRTLQYFERIANFHPPYYVLLDGPFLATMIKFKLVDVLRERLSTLLSHCSDVRFCVLTSTLVELERLYAANASNETIQAALQWCKNSTSTNCTILSNATTTTSSSSTSNHNGATPVSARAGNNDDATTKTKQTKKKSPEESPAAATVGAAVPPETVEGLSDAAKQLFDYVAHDPRYFVASQDEDLLSSLRQNRHIPVPIIRLSRTVLLLESPNYHHHNHHQSGGSAAAPNKGSELTPAEKELVGLIAAQQKQLSSSSSNSSTRRPPQKAKGPNPLSCKAPNNKKRKATADETTAASLSAKKRTRRKKSSSLSSQNDGTNGTSTV